VVVLVAGVGGWSACSDVSSDDVRWSRVDSA